MVSGGSNFAADLVSSRSLRRAVGKSSESLTSLSPGMMIQLVLAFTTTAADMTQARSGDDDVSVPVCY